MPIVPWHGTPAIVVVRDLNFGVLLDSFDDATRRQGLVRLFLPHSPFAPDPPTCWTGSHYTTRSCLGYDPP